MERHNLENKILTISIAAYNVEQYIKNTIESVIIEEIIDYLDIIIVDDGSTDDTFSIAKQYEEKYPKSIRIIKKSNGGYGSTVNSSIELAYGKYYKLLDGDDFFDKCGLMQLIKYLKEIDVDVVFTKFYKVLKEKRISAIRFENYPIDRIVNIDSIGIFEGLPMHTITYRTDILKKSKLKLREKILYSDNYYVSIPFTFVNNLVFKNIFLYNYRIDVLNQSINKNKLLKNANDLRIICEDLIMYYNSIDKKNVRAIKYIALRVASTLVDYFVVLMKKPFSHTSLEEIKEFDKYIYDFSNELYYEMGKINRKASRIIKIFRKTRYFAYYFIRPLYF